MSCLRMVLILSAMVSLCGAEEPSSVALDSETRDRCLTVLRNGLKSDDFWPSIHAAEGLTLAGYGKEVIAYLSPRLDDETDDQRRCGISRELVRAGDTSKTKVMLEILNGEDSYGHTHAAESLYKVGQTGDGKGLRRVFTQTNDLRLKLMAAGALGRSGNSEAMVFLREMLGHDNPELFRVAGWILGRIGDRSDIARLKKELPRCQQELARAYLEHSLAALGDANGSAALLKNLKSEDPAVRTYAATFAGDAQLLEAQSLLQEMLDDPHPDARYRAAQSLLSITSTANQQTDDRLSGKNLFERLDENGDGRVSREEAGDLKFFDKADRNANGFVTQREVALFAQQQRTQETGDTSSEPVFPADPQAIAGKRQILKQINPVTGRSEQPPNVVLIFSDDLGYADTSTYGSQVIPTPHLDALAQSGVKFTNSYVTAGSCSPSRAGLMTGRYQQRFGFEFNTSGGAITHRLHRGLDPQAIILADVMQAAGYATGMFGKWHLGTQPQFHPQVRGFDEFYGFLAGAHSFFPVKREERIHSTIMRGHDPIKESEYLTDAIARETVRFINAHADEPFFAYVPFNAVHTPIQATQEYQDRFPNVQDETRRDYYAMTSALDDAVGAIVDAIEKNQLTENTLVIFLNDNGGPMYTGVQSNGPLRMGKLFLFEGGIRVPMLMKWPGELPQNKLFEGVSSSLDIFPTVCAAAGISLPEDISLDGTDLIPYLTGNKSGAPHDTLFWSNGPNKAVRHQQWKLIQSSDSQWLFDLSADIGETKNLVGTHPEQLEKLEALLKSWHQQMRRPAWPSKPNRRKIEIDGLIYELNI